MANLRLAEAQALYEALQDPLLGPTLRVFFELQREQCLEDLVAAVRRASRDHALEASLAGKVDAAEQGFQALRKFAERELQNARQGAA